MSRLKKAEFDGKNRFREAREEGLVSCASCAHMSGSSMPKETAVCRNPERFTPITIKVHHTGGWGINGDDENVSPRRVCDAYTPKPLPDSAVLPAIPEGNVIILGSQWRGAPHADPTCPYVQEEVRLIDANGQAPKVMRKPEISFRDISDSVAGESIGDDLCEMPCCQSKLPFSLWRTNDYRRRNGLKPDGSEKTVWVRNAITKHEKKSDMTPEEAEAFFYLAPVVSGIEGIHNKIVAVSDYLHKKCSWLGSRPLSEAINPVSFSCYHHFLDGTQSKEHPERFWAYDGRLFDGNSGLKGRLDELDRIPEGFILCADSKRILRGGMGYSSQRSLGSFWARGILKPMEDPALVSKGVNHFMDIREVSYHGMNEMWGEYGIGFSGLDRFDEQ